MPTLNFDDVPASRPRKNLRLFLGVGTIAAVIGVSSTLASDISLNGGDNIEFGQGVATTAACDSSITITPVSEFANSDESTSTAARFPMNVIKVEDVDLTPEGWDLSLDPARFNSEFNPSLDPEDRSWNLGYEDRAGKYYNGTNWVPTCEGKVLLLRAYTNNSDYAQYTVAGSSTDSPLWLNRIISGPGNRSADEPFANAGVGIRVYYVPVSLYPDRLDDPLWITDVFVNDGGVTDKSDLTPIEPAGEYGAFDSSSWWTNPTIEIRLRRDLYSGTLLPVDSRFVDKITIESTGKKPIDWQVDEDWAGTLVIIE